mmetsp:Transcript_9723/g.23786  ORF Transcript_9723/g.23786 Transcript_9723/m.23786 type:complete len:270 (+) Transcript_9723:1027-1836(+)
MFSRLKFSAVASEIFLSNIESTVSVASISWILTSSFILGNECLRSSCRRSASSAANSTPVGPPPTTTKFSRRLRSASDWPGLHADSNASKIAARIRRASMISLRKWACCSTPGVLKVLFSAPTAMISLSYASSKSGRNFAPSLIAREEDSFMTVENDTVCFFGSRLVHSASTNLTWGQMARIDSTTVRGSTVPTVTDGRSGVITKWFLGETHTISYLKGSMFAITATAPQPVPRTTSRSLRLAMVVSVSRRSWMISSSQAGYIMGPTAL